MRLAGSLLVCTIVTAATAPASAAPLAGRSIGHDVWTFKEGAPGRIFAIVQTTDGFLCLGTPRGLFRFDDLAFERFRPAAGEHLVSLSVTALFAPQGGGLWIGYKFGGLELAHDDVTVRPADFVDGPPGPTLWHASPVAPGAVVTRW